MKDPIGTVLAGSEGGEIVCGLIAARTERMVGVTNFFTKVDHGWSSCHAELANRFSDATLVGYESGAALATARLTSFEVHAPLRVWVS